MESFFLAHLTQSSGHSSVSVIRLIAIDHINPVHKLDGHWYASRLTGMPDV